MPTERERQRQRTRERLYEAALDVFRRDGVEAARVDDIARLASVSRATFYFHFPSKDDVLVQRLAESQERIRTAIEDLAVDTPLAEVLALTAAHIAAEWKEDPHLLREVGTVALKLTARDLPEATRRHPVQLSLIPGFERAVRVGEIGTLIPSELMTEFFLVNLFGAALTWCAAPLAPLHVILDQVVTFFVRAARPGT